MCTGPPPTLRLCVRVTKKAKRVGAPTEGRKKISQNVLTNQSHYIVFAKSFNEKVIK